MALIHPFFPSKRLKLNFQTPQIRLKMQKATHFRFLQISTIQTSIAEICPNKRELLSGKLATIPII
jgi:hypothetical protein